MKRSIILPVLLLITAVLSGCGSGATTTPPAATIIPAADTLMPPEATLAPTPGAANVEDQASLLAALQAAGAAANIGDTVEQDFFTPVGQIVNVNDAGIQVFEYESAEAMEGEAAQVAPDGGSVGTSMMMWMDAPHFYKAGRIIVLYVGSDSAVLALLEQVIGPQFAGQ